MEIHVKIIGIILIVLAFVHTIFPKYFKWKEDFKNVSLINKEVMYVHTFFIALAICLMGILCLFSSNDLVETVFGKKICLGLAIFWTCRLLIQFFGYSTELWKGKIFETCIHILFSILWSYISLIFWLVTIS